VTLLQSEKTAIFAQDTTSGSSDSSADDISHIGNDSDSKSSAMSFKVYAACCVPAPKEKPTNMALKSIVGIYLKRTHTL
jgi:hypothetical protein